MIEYCDVPFHNNIMACLLKHRDLRKIHTDVGEMEVREVIDFLDNMN